MARIDTSPAPLMTPAQIITFDRVFCAALDSGMDWYSAMQKAHNAAGYSVNGKTETASRRKAKAA